MYSLVSEECEILIPNGCAVEVNTHMVQGKLVSLSKLLPSQKDDRRYSRDLVAGQTQAVLVHAQCSNRVLNVQNKMVILT